MKNIKQRRKKKMCSKTAEVLNGLTREDLRKTRAQAVHTDIWERLCQEIKTASAKAGHRTASDVFERLQR